MHAPDISLWVWTTLVFRPNAGLNNPTKPAAVQAARASATVKPTRFGTTRQLAIGVGVGKGDDPGVGVGARDGTGGGAIVGGGGGGRLGSVVGRGVAAGDGAIGVGFAVGADVGDRVGKGAPTLDRGGWVAAGAPGVAPPGDVPREAGVALATRTDGVTSGAVDGVSVRTTPAAASEGDAGSASPVTSACPAETSGVPTALSTLPVGRNDDPTTMVTASTATAVPANASGPCDRRRE